MKKKVLTEIFDNLEALREISSQSSKVKALSRLTRRFTKDFWGVPNIKLSGNVAFGLYKQFNPNTIFASFLSLSYSASETEDWFKT